MSLHYIQELFRPYEELVEAMGLESFVGEKTLEGLPLLKFMTLAFQ